MTNPFLFIVGCPRSGTTLLKRIVDAHPQIAITGHGPKIIRWFERREGLTPEGFITPELAEKGPILKFMSPQEFSGLVRQMLDAGRPISYASLISHMLDRCAEARGKRFVGHKAMSTGHKVRSRVRQIPTLHSLWPQAKFVHIIRDGRDVCLSVMDWRKAGSLAEGFATWTEDPVTTAALWWGWQVRLAREDGSALGPELYCEIRYEALVIHPEAECRALCAFLGVPYNGAMIRFHEGRMKTDPGLDAKHAWLPPTPGLRDWRKQMPPEDVERFEAAAGDLLDELGYPRGAQDLSPKTVEYAAQFRGRFDGHPLPQHW
ncbi:MAG: sulfotransferase [Candidatus Bipolaricaulia bacterium]